MTVETHLEYPSPGVAVQGAGGLVVVGVSSSSESRDAVEWAAVEAAARGAELRVVHVTPPCWLVDASVPFAGVDVAALAAANSVLEPAVALAREVAPEVCVTSRLLHGSPAQAIINSAPAGSLIVLGHPAAGWGEGHSVAARVVKRARAQVAVVGLSAQAVQGRSAGRVVAGYDGTPDSDAALDTAFAEAQARGLGLTALRMPSAAHHPSKIALTGDPLRRWRTAFPRVSIRDVLIPGPDAGALVEEARGAALVVLPEVARLWRRRLRPGTREMIDASGTSVIFVRP